MSNKETGTQGFFSFKEANIPKPTESKNKKLEFIEWGKDNLYPQFLTSLFYNSAIQNGIIRSKVHYTISGGLNYDGANREKWDLFFNNGKSDYNLNELTEQLSLDYELYNGFLIIGWWNMDKSGIARLEAVDYDKHRKKYGEDTILVSEDWSDSKVEPEEIKPFNPLKKDGHKFYLLYEEKPKQIKEGRDLTLGNYPLPPYSGAITSLLTDIKINKYQLNEISNNFSLGAVLNLNNGIPPDGEQKINLEKDIKKQATGEDNAGGVLVLYNNGKDREATVLQLNGNDLNDRYLSLSKDVRENILLSHSVTTPILFGIKTEGSLGNATELETGYTIMKNNYFNNRRKVIASSLSYLASRGNNLQGDIFFNDVVLFEDKKEVEVIVEDEELNKFKAFQEENKIIDLFKSHGRERTKDSLFTRVLPNDFDIDVENENCLNEFSKTEFIGAELEIQVLKLINDGNDFKTIRQALSLNPSELALAYKKFRGLDYIDDNGNLTNLARRRIAQNDTSITEIVFSYDINPAISNQPIIDTTRDFCKQLVELSKTRVWTRQDIETISGFVGYNVFNYRGGWYHNPDTNKTTPWCRHIWKQEIVLR